MQSVWTYSWLRVVCNKKQDIFTVSYFILMLVARGYIKYLICFVIAKIVLHCKLYTLSSTNPVSACYWVLIIAFDCGYIVKQSQINMCITLNNCRYEVASDKCKCSWYKCRFWPHRPSSECGCPWGFCREDRPRECKEETPNPHDLRPTDAPRPPRPTHGHHHHGEREFWNNKSNDFCVVLI